MDTALRLSRYFGNSPELWINLQTHYELELAEHYKLTGKVSRGVTPRQINRAVA